MLQKSFGWWLIVLKKYIVTYYFKKARDYYSNGYINKSINCLDKILFLDKKNNEALILKGIYYTELFDKKNSFDCLNQALDNGLDELEFYYQKALACFYLEEYEMSIQLFDKVLSKIPNHLFSLNKIGYCYLYLEEYDLAYKYFIKVLNRDDRNIDALVNISIYYNDLGEYDDALIYLNKALKINPKDESALLQTANIYKDKNDYKNANKYIDLAIEQNPNDLILKMSKYLFLAGIGEFEESLSGFDNISKLKFDSCSLINRYYLFKGLALELMGKYEDALMVYNEFLEKYDFFRDDIEKEREEVIKLLSK